MTISRITEQLKSAAFLELPLKALRDFLLENTRHVAGFMTTNDVSWSTRCHRNWPPSRAHHRSSMVGKSRTRTLVACKRVRQASLSRPQPGVIQSQFSAERSDR